MNKKQYRNIIRYGEQFASWLKRGVRKWKLKINLQKSLVFLYTNKKLHKKRNEKQSHLQQYQKQTKILINTFNQKSKKYFLNNNLGEKT